MSQELEKVDDQKYICLQMARKKSKLRNYFEKSGNDLVPCYKDNEIILKIINED